MLLLLLLMGVHPSVLGGILLRLLMLGNAIAGSEPLADAGTEEGGAGRPTGDHRRGAALRIRAGVLIQRLGQGRRQAARRMGGRSVGVPAVDGPVLRHGQGVLRRGVGPDGTPGVLLLLTPDADGTLLLLLLGGKVGVTVTPIRRRWLLLEVVEGIVALLPPWTTTRRGRGGTSRGQIG